jgi:hypothetical protein
MLICLYNCWFYQLLDWVLKVIPPSIYKHSQLTSLIITLLIYIVHTKNILLKKSIKNISCNENVEIMRNVKGRRAITHKLPPTFHLKGPKYLKIGNHFWHPRFDNYTLFQFVCLWFQSTLPNNCKLYVMWLCPYYIQALLLTPPESQTHPTVFKYYLSRNAEYECVNSKN